LLSVVSIPVIPDIFPCFLTSLTGISFDYPSDWEVQEKENRFDTGADVSVSNGDLKFFVSKLDRPVDDPLTGLPEFARSLEQGLARDETNTIIEHTDVKKYKISGESAGTFLVKTDDGTSSYGIQVFAVIHAGDGYMLNFRDSTKTFDTPETQMIMNKILQSFKFLN
jgi:PsbP-like protein